MEDSKIKFTDEELTVLANRFKILAEPSRLKIMRTLFAGEKCVTEIIDETGLLQANVSKQLKMLQNNNIVSCRPEGLQRFYRIIDKTILNMCNQVCKALNTEVEQ